jgi:CBS domain-containing protein
MDSAIERLLSLRVADFMRRNVLAVSADATMGEAAESFLRHKVSGAPVIDEVGHCTGVLSAADFVRREAQGPPRPMGNGDFVELVRAYMSPSVHSIAAQATLIDAARAMCGKHVHRLPVLDARGKVVGVISSLDLVAAMVHSIEE